jgi:5-methylcytosine-specific restriction enzyme subunit McrC
MAKLWKSGCCRISHPKTGGQWQLASQGWVGYIPLAPELGFHLSPKVPLRNLFGMLEYAYRLKSFNFLKGLISCDSLEEFYEQLAKFLALRVLDRGQKGYYRAYVPQTDQLPFVTGRIDARQTSQKPWSVKLECSYEEHTSDIEDNQILTWTFQHILRSGLCTERTLSVVRKAYRILYGLATPEPFKPQDCVCRRYNRLNQDYQPMHALCRFFLDQSGPSHQIGDRTMLPFLVNMARLYELFVAEWLKIHLPAGWSIKAQEIITMGQAHEIQFNIDLVLYDGLNNVPRCVLDTKYKSSRHPDPADIEQIVAYAEMKGCQEAVIIYPLHLCDPLDVKLKNSVRIRSLAFPIDGNLEMAGQSFIGELLLKKSNNI